MSSDVPGIPVGKPAVSNITADSLTLAWYGPGYDGGSKVIGYKIEKASCSVTGWTEWSSLSDDCKDTCFRAGGLESNTEYRFRISVKNINGFGPPGETTDSVYTLFPYDYDSSNPLSPLSLSTPLSPMALLAARGEFPFKPRTVTIVPGRKFEESYILKEEIGKGRFGEVFLCLDKNSEIKYAAKFIKLRGSHRQDKKQEIDIMNQLQHPKLMMLWDAFETPRELIMVMEHVGGGELFDRIIDDDYVLTERECAYFVKQICTGVGFMHAKHIVHLDLKPENILCLSHNSNEIKIIDFGLAKKHNVGEELKAMVGSAEFVAPEVINFNPIGFGADMWSIGVVTYLILSGISPFAGDTQAETLANVTKAEWSFDEELFADFSPSAKEFVSSLIIKDPRKRASASDCLLHKWLTQNMQLIRAQRISTREHKRYMARKKWHKSAHALRAINRLIKTSPDIGISGELKHDASSQVAVAGDDCIPHDSASSSAQMEDQNTGSVKVKAESEIYGKSINSNRNPTSEIRVVHRDTMSVTAGVDSQIVENVCSTAEVNELPKMPYEKMPATGGIEVDNDRAVIATGRVDGGSEYSEKTGEVQSDVKCLKAMSATADFESNASSATAGVQSDEMALTSADGQDGHNPPKTGAVDKSHSDPFNLQSSTNILLDTSSNMQLYEDDLSVSTKVEDSMTEVKTRSTHLKLNVKFESGDSMENLPDSHPSTIESDSTGDRVESTRSDSNNFNDLCAVKRDENSNAISVANNLVSESWATSVTSNSVSQIGASSEATNLVLESAVSSSAEHERRSNCFSKTEGEREIGSEARLSNVVDGSNSKTSVLLMDDKVVPDDKTTTGADVMSSTVAETENLAITPTVRSSFRISLQAQHTSEDMDNKLVESKDNSEVTVPLKKKSAVVAQASCDEIDNTQQQRASKKVSVTLIPSGETLSVLQPSKSHTVPVDPLEAKTVPDNATVASNLDAFELSEAKKSDKSKNTFSSSIDVVVSGNQTTQNKIGDSATYREGGTQQRPQSVEYRPAEMKPSEGKKAAIYDSRDRTSKAEGMPATSPSMVSKQAVRSLKAKFEQGNSDAESLIQSVPTRKTSSTRSTEAAGLTLPNQVTVHMLSQTKAADRSEATAQGGHDVTDSSWQRKISSGSGRTSSSERVVIDRGSAKNTTTSSGLVASLRQKFANNAHSNASIDTDSGFTSPTNDGSFE